LEDYLTITLFNQTYKFKFDADKLNGREAADILLSEVEKLDVQHQESVHVNKFVVLVMAALNIAVDNIAQRRNCQGQLSVIGSRSLQLIRRLDSYIALHMDLMGG
jgi:hypothetical protein